MAFSTRAGAPRPDARAATDSPASAQPRGARAVRVAAIMIGLLAGLRLAVPPSDLSATALLEIGAVMLAFWLIAELVVGGASGRSQKRETTGSSASAAADPLLAAASWGVAPKQRAAEPAPPKQRGAEPVPPKPRTPAPPAQEVARAEAPPAPERDTSAEDEALLAASWGVAPAKAGRKTPRKPKPRPDKVTDKDVEQVEREQMFNSVLTAASLGSDERTETSTDRKPAPAPTSPARQESPAGATRAADPLLAAASWNAPKPADARRRIDPHVLRGMRLPGFRPPSLRLPRLGRLSRLPLPTLSDPGAKRVVHILFLVVGVVVGLRWALPIADVSSHCPPQGEGQVMCTIQKAWLAALVQFAAPIVAAQVLARLTLRTIPQAIRRWRAGERPARLAKVAPSEHFADDPALRAAAWGRTGEDESADDSSVDRELVARVRAPKVVRVRSAPRARNRS